MLKQEFIESLSSLGDAANGLVDALQTQPSVSIRMNPHKTVATLPAESDGEVPYCEGGYFLKERPLFTLDPAWHQGRYYVQDASSMFVASAVKQLTKYADTPLLVLDSCAAPGGKTLAATDMLPAGSVMVCNEIVPKRAAILRENVIKWGLTRAIVTRGDTEALAKSGVKFDLIIADVPCSGEGMMRKDSEAAEQWSEGLVSECAELQHEIAENLWEALRPGGILLYSTCTFNLQENELQVARLIDELEAESVPLEFDPSWGIMPSLVDGVHAARFLPGRVRGEGLFMAALRKPGDSTPALQQISAKKAKSKPAKITPADRAVLEAAASWIADDAQMSISDGRVNASVPEVSMIASRLSKHTDIIHDGIPVGIIKGRDLTPLQSLAMSQGLKLDAFPKVDVDRDTALSYLRRDAVVVPDTTPRGLVLLTFEGAPLGFVKNLGNRTNNLYPAEWRILMH